MADATTVEGFPAPLATNSGWRLSGHMECKLGDFKANAYGELYYKGALVGTDPTYGAVAYATAGDETEGEATAAIAAMPA